MDQNHLILLSLSFLILIANDEAVRTPTESPNRGRRPLVPSTPGYNIPTTPGYDTGRNPSMQNLGASQGSYPPSNPFMTSGWDTMPNMSMAPGSLQQQQQLQQNWGQQQQSVLQQYTATEYLSPSFNQPRKQTVSNSGRHNGAANANLEQWSNPSTYETIVKQQKADGYNYGDYEGELILDFEFARPAEDTENEDEAEKEDNTTGSDTKPGGERVDKSERPKKKTEKKVEDSSSEVKKTKTAKKKVDESESTKTDKKKVDESTRTDKKKVDESTRTDKKKAKKGNVEVTQLEEKYEKKLKKSVEQLRLSLNEQKMCSLQNSKDCWMRLFDALAELDDELRYSNMIQYCSENKQQIRYCGGSNCPDIENVIVFKNKTEEDEVVIEKEKGDEEENESGKKEQKSEEQNVPKTDERVDGDHSADQQSFYEGQAQKPTNPKIKPLKQQTSAQQTQAVQHADHYSQAFNMPERKFDGIAEYLQHTRSQIEPTGYGRMGTPPNAPQSATAPQYHFPSDGHSMAQLPYSYELNVPQQPNPSSIYSMLNPMNAQAEQPFYQPEHQQLDHHHQQPLPPIVNEAPKKRRNKPAQSQPFSMPETQPDGTASFLQHSASRIESTGQYGSRMGTAPIGRPVAEPQYPYSPAFNQHDHHHQQHPFSAMAHHPSSYGATGYQSSDGVSPNRPAYGQPQSDHITDPNIYYPYSQPKTQQKRAGGTDRQGYYAQHSQSGNFIPQDNLQNSAAYAPQQQPSQYGMPGYSQLSNYSMQQQQPGAAGTAPQYAQQGNQNAETGGYYGHGPAMPRPVYTVPSGGGRKPSSMKPNAAGAVPANPRRPKGTARPPSARHGSVSGPNAVDEYDFTVFNVNENRKQSSTTSKASSSSSSAKLEQRKPETAEEKKEHMGNHLSMYMRCVNKLLTERAPIGLINAGDKVSTNFLQLLYGMLLPKPLFLAQQLNMALNGVPKDQIDNPLLMAPKIAPSASDTLSVETSMSKNVLNKLSKSNRQQPSNVKHDVRAVLEIASTQSRDQLKQIRKISEALGYPNFADAGKIFIKQQSATFEAKESIVKFLDWRLMGRAVAPIKEDYSKKHPEIRSAKADAKTLYIAMKGVGTNVNTLNEILVNRSNKELIMIQKALKALYGNTLKHYIKNEKGLSAEYQELLYDLIDANRDEIFCNDQYQAKEDAFTLKEGGIDKIGTEGGKFIRILSNANLFHLHLVIEQYNLLRYMSSFEADIDEEFSDPLKSGLLAIVSAVQKHRPPRGNSMQINGENDERCPAYYYTKKNDYIMAEAERLYKAVHGRGCTKEEVVKVLVHNNNAQIRAITRAYNETHGHRKPKTTKNQKSSRSLRDRIKDELKDDVGLLALDLLEGNRNEQQNFVPDCEKAENQAAELLHPGKGALFNFARRFTTKIGVKVFIAILANEHFKQLRLIFEMYKKNSGTNGSAIDVIKAAIDNITNSNTLKDGLKTVVDLAVQKVNDNELEKILNDCKKLNDEQQIENLSDEYYVTDAEKDAALLRKAMQGWGTNEKTLIWILTTRKNNREISDVYKTMYGNELLDRIKEETSGIGESNFQDALKQLLGSTREDSPTFKPDKIKAKKQAVELFDGNGTKFVNIMATMHSNQLLLIFDEYEKLYKIKNRMKLKPSTNYTFEILLKKKFDGDFLRTLLAIVSLARKGIDETERVLQKDAQEKNWIKTFWHYLVDLYKGYKSVTELELNEYNDFVKYCDEGGSEARACSTTITPEDKYRIRDLHEKYFTKKITRSLKDLLGIFKLPSTKERAKIDLHRVIIARYQHDLGDILRSIDRLSLKQIVDRFESWHFTFGEIANGKLFETEDKLYAHALKKLLNIENAKQITGYEDFLENYGPNLQDFMEKLQNDQYEFGIEMKKPKKGEDERVSVNIHLYNLPKPLDGTSVSNQYENVSKKELRKPTNLAKYMSESKFMHDLLQIMSQDLIDRLDLMYRARLKKALLAKDDIKKFEQRILGNPEVMENLIEQWKRGQQKHQSYNENIENIKPTLIEMEMNPEKSSDSYKYQVWNIWGEAKEKPTRQAITTQLYIDHVNVFKLLFWARFYALAIALQRVPMQMANDGEAKGVGKKESAQLFGMEYDQRNNLVESAELGATFRLDIPHEAWPDETRQATEEMRKKFEQDLDCLEEYILYNFNHQMFYGGQPRFYQVGYETLLKLGYDDVLKGTKLRTLLVHEMEELLEEVDSGVNKENDDDFSLKTVHFTKANVQLFKKREGEEKLHGVQKWIQKAFTWLDGLVDKMHKKSLTKRNRMQRYLFDKMQTFTSELRGLFTGQTPPIKWIMKKCMPMLYYGAKYGKKLLKGVGKLFKPMLSIFKSSKEKMGYKHKKSRLESKKAMFGLLLEIDSAVQDNTKMKNNWRGKSNAIWANDKEMERIWATEINKVKVDDKDKVSEDDREEMIGMIKDGSEVPWWMVKVKPPGGSANAKKETSKVNSRRKKRLAIRKATGTDNQRFDIDGVQSIAAAPFAVADDAVDNARPRRRKRFAMGGRAMAARSVARRAYSPSYHPFGGSYYTGYHYSPYNCYYYRPYHLTHKQLLAELWTVINIFAAFIVVPISAAFWDLDCSSSGSSSSSYYGGSYHYDYTAAQKLREKAEKKRIKQEKESELDYQIADWNKEISYGTKQNKSGHRRKKRSSAGMDSKIVGWQTEDSFGLNKNDERHRRTKRSVAQDCGAYIGTLIFLLWIIVWIGGYFLIAFGPI